MAANTSANTEAMNYSRVYIEGRVGWAVIEETLRVIDAERAIWVSRVSTTHLKERGEESEMTFTVLVHGQRYLEIHDEHVEGVVEGMSVSQSIVRQNGPSKRPPLRIKDV